MPAADNLLGTLRDGRSWQAERPNAVPVALMSGEKLVELLAEHQFGFKRQPHDLFELEEEDKSET